jgi:hypothetical protein
MASRLNDGRETTATEFLADVEAEARARWLLSRRCGENGSLVLETIETRDDGTATVSFSSPSQWEYEVDLILEDGIVTLARVKRVGAENSVTSRDLHVLVDQTTEPVASQRGPNNCSGG